MCANQVWDTFYVVTTDLVDQIKFGISSLGGYVRLRSHRRAGYRIVIRRLENLPGTVAPDMESAVLATLRLAGIGPVHGREHFPANALSLVLDIVDNYPIGGTRAA
jgi:hypothetical protein